MKRITVEDVVEASAALPGLRVVTKRFGDQETCGCPLTIYAIHRGMDVYFGDAAINWLVDHRDFDRNYLWGFACGVDGASRKEVDHLGYEDGAAVRRALSLT